jgi:hypothetical protein
MEGH